MKGDSQPRKALYAQNDSKDADEILALRRLESLSGKGGYEFSKGGPTRWPRRFDSAEPHEIQIKA